MKRITILIADDEVEIADLVALHLQKEGYHIVKAFDGKAAVQAVQTQAIDLAILDIMMPGMDGYEVTRKIREATSFTDHFPECQNVRYGQNYGTRDGCG